MVLNVVEMYDIADAKWSTLPPMPTARHAEVVATVGEHRLLHRRREPADPRPASPAELSWTRIVAGSTKVAERHTRAILSANLEHAKSTSRKG